MPPFALPLRPVSFPGFASLLLASGSACTPASPGAAGAGAPAARLSFALTIDSALATAPVDGRMLLFIAADETGMTSRFSSDPVGIRLAGKMAEPRFLTSDFDNTAQILASMSMV